MAGDLLLFDLRNTRAMNYHLLIMMDDSAPIHEKRKLKLKWNAERERDLKLSLLVISSSSHLVFFFFLPLEVNI